MENKDQGVTVISVQGDTAQPQESSPLALPPTLDSEDLSLDPGALAKPPPIQAASTDNTNLMVRILKRADVVLVFLLVLGVIGLVAAAALRKPPKALQANIADQYDTQQIPLESFVVTPQGVSFGDNSVVINGSMQLNNGLVMTPSERPAAPATGQLYYDKTSNQLAYYNGAEFISVIQQGAVVQSIGGVTGAVTLGSGLGVVGNQLVVTSAATPSVVSVGGQNGAITLGNGLQMSGNTLTNGGVLSLAAGTPNLQVVDDGSGNLTISAVGGGTGTVTSGGGTVGRIAKFTGVQNVEDSILSESGLTVTANGSFAVTGTLALSNALTVSNGGTGATTLTNNGVLLGQGASAITAVTGSPGDCLVVNGGGVPAFGSCSGGGSVSSLNSLTGALTIADSTGLGSTITINDATTAAKGIASFSGTNFSVTSGAVNTVQNINAAASPTFAGVNTNTITPSAALTVGTTTQPLTLQGNGGTVLTATSAGSTTTIAFQAPTANVTYRFATAALGTYDICTTTGNCAGVGGGVTTLGGNTNRLAKFTGGSSIGDSSITDNGTTVTTTSDVVVQGGNVTLGIANTQTGTLTLAYGSANFSGTILQGTLAADRTYTLPDTDGTFCLSSGNCLGGGSGGANTSLSNLTGVAINTTLLPGAAGAINLGSGTLPFGDLFIAGSSGTPGTNNFRVTGVSTSGTRTITLPDESGTVCTNASGSTTCQGNFVLNQNAGNQAGDFRITGSGRANTSLLTPLLDTPSGTTILAIGTTNATGGINLNQTTTVAANSNLIMASGTGTFTQTYTGTGDAHTITANSLTTGSALNVTSINNTAANTAWSAVLLNVTSAQSSTAVSTGTIAGFDVQFTQNAAITGNVDTVANFAVKRNDSASTDQTVTSILNVANLDTATGNQINVTDGIKVNGGANIANGINLSGTFNTNLLTSNNVTITQGGTITTAGDAAINGGDITSSGALNITPSGVLVVGVTGQTATLQGSVTTITSNGGTNNIILNSANTIELQDATNVTGTLSTTSTLTLGALGTTDTATYLCRNSANQLAGCQTAVAGSAFVQGGNSFSATAVLGTNDNFGLNLEVNNTAVMTIGTNGAATLQNITDTTGAFVVINATSVPQFSIDTSNSRTYIGNPTGDTTGALLVLDTKTSSGDPTGLDGAMYYNSNLGAFRCYQYDFWRDCIENARTSFHAYTDLMGASGTLYADMHFYPFSSGGTAAINDMAGVAGHPGVAEMLVDADNSQAALQSAGSDNQIILGNTDTWRFETVVRVPTLSTAGQTFILRSGFLDTDAYAEADTGSSNNAGGCYFKYTHGVNGGRWQGTCVDNSATVSTCDTGTSVSASTWYRLTMTVNSAGNSVDFRVNGATTNGAGRCQVTAQIPTSTGVGYANFLMKTNGSSAVTVEVDYEDILGQFGTPR